MDTYAHTMDESLKSRMPLYAADSPRANSTTFHLQAAKAAEKAAEKAKKAKKGGDKDEKKDKKVSEIS